MHILHGTWIPNETDSFHQSGEFCLWVETVATNRRGSQVISLPAAELAELLAGELGIAREPAHLRRTLQTRYLLLPEAAGKLLPSPELARTTELASPEPETPIELRSEEVDCYILRDVLAELKNLHFLCEYQLTEVQAGADFRFWHRAGRTLARVLGRDQYIPALKYRPLKSGKNQRKKTSASFEIHPGWEAISDDYADHLRQLQDHMPALCQAGAEKSYETPALYDSEKLLRHFSECVLDRQISRVSMPTVFTKRIEYTLLDRCLHPHETESVRSNQESLGAYREWQRWRRALTLGSGTSGFQLGLQLLEADSESEPWFLVLIAVSRSDPSLRPPLADYWHDAATRQLLKQRFGADFEKQLLLQLGYAARMYPRLWDGLDNAEPEGLELSLEEAFEFLKEHAWVLQDAGFKVLAPAWWTPEGRSRAKLRLRATGQSTATAAAGPGYFSLNALVRYRYELAIGEETVSPEEWRQLVDAKSPLVHFRGQWLELDPDKMQRMLDFWETHGHEDAEIPLGGLLVKAAAGEDEIDVSHDDALSDMLSTLNNPSRLEPIDQPSGLHGELREYQKRGVAWLGFLEGLGLGACLADDMGLGKTVQVLARLLTAGTNQGPTLLIAPTSVLGNWRREVERFTPGVSVLIHHGSERLAQNKDFKTAVSSHNLIITSFTLARKDAKLLQTVDWQRVVIDEAQNIKNPRAAQTKAILKLKTHQRLALTGTPVENRLLDLWSIFNFINPGYLGTQARFRKDFELPVQRDNDPAKAAVLKKLVQPFILRRIKTDKNIIKDLPDKVENRQYCNLTPEQASLYQAVVDDVERELQSAEGMQRRGLILATLMRLKQICNHPAQFLQDNSAFEPARSHKLERLMEMLDEVIQKGESLLIFTQFTEIGGALEKLLRPRCRTYYLHGGTAQKKRERMIADFQAPEGEPAAFVLSLKAGGVGITLTRANHVFHFDRWWNPAVEDQATDRAYRIGQSLNVFVHKFVTLGTLEERIDQMIEDKKAIAGSIVGNDEAWLTELSNERFKALIRLNREAVME